MRFILQNEIIRLYRKYIVHTLLVTNILLFAYYFFFDRVVFNDTNYITTSIYNFSIVIMYMSCPIVVTNFFSKENDEGLSYLILMSPMSRRKILTFKVLSIVTVCLFLMSFNMLIYSAIRLITYSKIMLGIDILKGIIFQLINLIPLVCFILILILFDIICDNSILTITFGMLLVLSIGILPNTISQYIITYYMNISGRFVYSSNINFLNVISIFTIYIVLFSSSVYFVYLKKEY